ncbi:hypothetical protein NIES4072_39750 [Nostoc commune NIES-4072]|uniref:Uncharacterized protein n=1 Tax=Nostoc commune NIES-4072 TaxID=2005467 RepID=A0A2R5FS29_NOSCO|nr:hypothetical protein NIES4070_51020 [Nostoc commune HK-02]GBG20298.1 hypothetical protein NIES4072_39750 [Nostoc commune NIES-4072]
MFSIKRLKESSVILVFILGLTHTLRILGALGVLAVREIKLFSNFCVSPIYYQTKPMAIPLAIHILHKAFGGYFVSFLKAISRSSL